MWKNSVFVIPLLFALAVLYMTVQSANAEPFPNIERGQDYDRIYLGVNPDGTLNYSWTSAPQRIYDGIQYRNYIVSESDDAISFEGAVGSYSFNKNSCEFDMYAGGKITGASSMRLDHIIKESENGTNIWSMTPENDFTCAYSYTENDKGIQLVASKGDFTTVYDIDYTYGFEWTYKYTNNKPEKTNTKYGFTFQCTGDKCDDIQINDQNLGNGELTKTQLENKKIRVGEFEFDPKNDVHDYLWSLKRQSNKLIVDFTHAKGALAVGETLEVDPTFSQTGTWYRVLTSGAAGAACPGAPYSNSTLQTVPVLGDSDDATGVCGRGGFRYILTAIPDTATILDVDFNLTGTAVDNGGGNCNLGYVSAWQPDRTSQQQWNDIGSMSNYLTNNALCTSATFQTFDLGNQANTDVQNSLSSNKYILGLKFTTETRSSVADTRFTHTGGALTVVYVTQLPNPPTSLSADSQARKVSYSWTQTSGTSITGYYIGRSLNNVTFTNKTLVGNVTTYLDTAYYRPGLLYYANITAYNGINSTIARYTSFTMDDYPGAPQNPYNTILNSTAVKLNWSPPTDTGNDSITGYRVERTTGFACTGTFTVLTNHTTALNYNNTGLSTTQQYCYRIGAWNGVGLGDYSAGVVRFALPDPVSDLVISAIGLTNIDIAWSTPGLNGGTLSGYQINYTTPSGTPLTIISNNTLSAATAYSVTGLTQDTAYCFRVGAWTNAGIDADGNIACGTTYVLANFTIGFFDVNSTNPEQVPIRYERSELNASATNVKVIYPNTADLDCLLDFSFAQSQEAYNNINGSTYDVDQDYEDFIFANSGNDIITIDCTNSNNNDTARYVVTQDGSFVLLDMLRDFRNGTYGTMGFIGTLDLITVLVVIISMIGFNRVSGQVGIIFNIFLIGVASYFEIIDFDWVWLPALVLIAMVVILSTRKDG